MNRIASGLLKAMFLALCMVPVWATASPGGTDANGGHYEHSTGLYHYHHGYPAHQHVNGVCPYTNQVWELAIPERPATLSEWEKQKHAENEVAAIDDQTPENEEWKKAKADRKGNSSAALPIAAAAGGAALLGGAFAAARAKKKKTIDTAVPERTEPKPVVPEPDVPGPTTVTTEANAPKETASPEPQDMSPEAVIPSGTVIGSDGLPWEREAYEREQAKPHTNYGSAEVATNFSVPKWGRLYSFCVDADGDEIHTLDCKMAFIQINVADRTCPKLDCPVCKPVRPDLTWFEEYQKRKKAMNTQETEDKVS